MYDSQDQELVAAGTEALKQLRLEGNRDTIQEYDDEEDGEAIDTIRDPSEWSKEEWAPDTLLHVKAANLRAGIARDAFLNMPTNVELAVLKRLYAYATPEVDRLVEEEEQQLCGEKVKIYNIHKVPTGSRRGEGQAENIPGAQISDDQAYIANRKVVIERDTDLLTKDEIEKHREEVTAATVAELLTWNKHGCFSRKPKRQARNIVDCKW